MALQEFLRDYAAIAASQTTAAPGPNGGSADGDILHQLVIIPASTSPGSVKIRDGSNGTDITVFAGGASSLADLKPFTVNLGLRAKGDSTHKPRWLITTGASISVIAVGMFH